MLAYTLLNLSSSVVISSVVVIKLGIYEEDLVILTCSLQL